VGTAKTARSVLSSMFGLAARTGAIAANPVRDAAPATGSVRKAPRALTRLQTEEVSDALRSMRRAVDLDIPDLVDWMFGTGMRIGEACAIREGVLDLVAGTVEVDATVIRVKGRSLVLQEHPKTAAGWRVLALPPNLEDMLKRRQNELRLRGPQGVVFGSPTGKLRDPNNTSGDLRECLDRIGCLDGDGTGPFAWVTSHTFRKTVATRMDEAGASPRQIADQLGHSKPSMTQDLYMGRKVVCVDASRILAR